MSTTGSPPPENPIIVRLQAKHFAALDDADWGTACDTLNALRELRIAQQELRTVKQEQAP